MSDVFISYARADAPQAQRLSALLEGEGVGVFQDQALVAGENWSAAVRDALADSRIIVALLSRNSVRSKWVEEDILDAMRHGQRIAPVLLDEHGKENWVWPVLAGWQAFDLTAGNTLESVAAAVLHTLRKKDAEQEIQQRSPYGVSART